MINIKSFGVRRKDGGSSSSNSSSGGYANTTIQTEVNGINIWGQYHDHNSDIDGDITTSGNITAQGDITTNAAIDANTIHSQTTIEAEGALSADDGNFSGDVHCVDINCSNIDAAGDISCGGDLTAYSAEFDYLTSGYGTITNLVADYLTVTKQAHFFELIIDKIKSNSGQVILSAANAKIEHVVNDDDVYYCYWRKKDAETNKAIDNEFVVNDQVRCQTFNVQEGTNFNASNKYYWRLVEEVGTDTVTIDGEQVLCNYVALSDTDKDGTSVPEVGDEIVQLGNRTDASRQSAIILSSVASIDSNVQAPSIVQYAGINGYSLNGCILNQIARNGTTLTGNFKVVTGNTTTDVIDLINGETATIYTNSEAAFVVADSNSKMHALTDAQGLPTSIEVLIGNESIPPSNWTNNSYIKNGTQSKVYFNGQTQYGTGLCITSATDNGNGGATITWGYSGSRPNNDYTISSHEILINIEYTYNHETKTIQKSIPLSVIKSGQTIAGADAEFDKMKVNDCDLTAEVSDVLSIKADVEVMHIKGDTHTILSDLTDYTCYLQFRSGGGRYTLTKNATKFTITQTVNGWQNNNPFTSATLTLLKNNEVVDTFVAAVKFNAGSMFEVKNDAITAAVQQSQTYTDGEITTVNADIAQVQLTAQGLNSRVTNIEGDYVTSSQLTQTANNIQLNVFNELNEKTGIDVQNGQITLNAENTTINGNLNLNNTDNGITVYDEDGTARIQIQPQAIGSISDFDSGTSYLVKSNVKVNNASTYSQTTVQRKIGYFDAGDVLTMKNIKCLLTSSDGTQLQNPTANFTAVIKLYHEGTQNPAYTFNRTFTYSNGSHTTSDITYTIQVSGVYLFNASITYNATPLNSLYEEVTAMIDQTITHQTYIGSDGFYCNPYSNAMLWAGSEEIQLRWGYEGIRLNEDGLQRLPPNYIQQNELWLPFDNVIRTTTILPAQYTLSGREYNYTINPLTDIGLLLAYVPSFDETQNSTNIYLPSYQFTIEGVQYYLPRGYMIQIKNAEVNNIVDTGQHSYNNCQAIWIHMPNGSTSRCLLGIVKILHMGSGQWLLC